MGSDSDLPVIQEAAALSSGDVRWREEIHIGKLDKGLRT